MTGNVRPETMERITNKALAEALIFLPVRVEGINRVMVDVTPKSVGTIEFE